MGAAPLLSCAVQHAVFFALLARFRDADARPHPSQRTVFPPQLTPEDVVESGQLQSAFRIRSSDPSEDAPELGAEWRDVVVDSDGLARVCTIEDLLPGTRYRFRMVFRPRLSKRYKRAWMSWREVALSDWFRTDGGWGLFRGCSGGC